MFFNLCSGILILIYHLLLEREKMFVYNRFYLLAALIFSTLAPLISVDMEVQPALQPVVERLPDIDKGLQTVLYFQPENLAFRESMIALSFDWVLLVYYIVATALLLRFLYNIAKIFRLKSTCRLHISKEATFVLAPNEIGTFTFLRYIFIPEKSFENQQIRSEIVAHELAHARQLHSADMLLIGFLQAVLWFNPFVFLYKKAIRLNHEFLADEAVLH